VGGADPEPCTSLTVPAKKRLGGGGDADPGPGSGPPPVVPALSKHKGFVLLSPTV